MNETRLVKILVVDKNKEVYSEIHNSFKNNSGFFSKDQNTVALVSKNSIQNSADSLNRFVVSWASNSENALHLVEKNIFKKQAFSLVFIDTKKLSAWEVVLIIKKLFTLDPCLQVCVISSYSENIFDDVIDQLTHTDNVTMLKKPFSNLEVRQLIVALAKKSALKLEVDFVSKQLHVEMRERDLLLEKMACSSVKMLSEVLFTICPKYFSNLFHINPILNTFLMHLEVKDPWPIEIAVKLSQIHSIILSIEKEEDKVGCNILNPIENFMSELSFLNSVKEILDYQNKNFDGSGLPHDHHKGNQIPLGARILRIVLDYDELKSKEQNKERIFEQLFKRKGIYDENLLERFSLLFSCENKYLEMKEIPIASLESGMILANDLFSRQGMFLVGEGSVLSPIHVIRIKNIAKQIGIKEPIRIISVNK